MISGSTVNQGNWAAFAVLLYSSLHVLYTVFSMEAEFISAEIVQEDIRAMLPWRKVSGLGVISLDR
jgi:hypothetical protein